MNLTGLKIKRRQCHQADPLYLLRSVSADAYLHFCGGARQILSDGHVLLVQHGNLITCEKQQACTLVLTTYSLFIIHNYSDRPVFEPNKAGTLREHSGHTQVATFQH